MCIRDFERNIDFQRILHCERCELGGQWDHNKDNHFDEKHTPSKHILLIGPRVYLAHERVDGQNTQSKAQRCSKDGWVAKRRKYGYWF